MKISFLRLLFIGVIGGMTFSALNAQQSMDSLSYSLGVLMAQNLKQQGFKDLNAADLAKAIEDVMSGNTLAIDERQCSQIYSVHMQELRKTQEAEQSLSGQKNLEEGKAFLAENGKRPEVTTTASGLQYEVLKAAEGIKPKATSTVKVHYHGTLISGKVFDSSVERGEPIDFPLNRVIPGWTEGVQLMSVGSKFRFYIPSELAYGERGAGADIGPNSTLIFDVELLEVQ